ncbi:MAG: hypothetical protein GX174_13410 [Lentisphaerae bacterium]|jgi:hypothetical protein|nr:hypothetical protein [Lentisphaerota bacterium]
MHELKIGWASRDISTDKPVDIPGQFHIRVSRGVLDPITATALVIDNGEDLLIFVSADLVSIRAYLVEEVRALVKAREPGIPVDKIIISATHTHDGAGYYRKAIAGMATPDQVPHAGIEIASSDEYRGFLAGSIADAICEAYAGRQPGGVTYGYGFAAVGHSRREVYFDDLSKRPGSAGRPGMMVDGHAKMYGPTRDPMFSHYEAGMDPFVNLLYTFDAQGNLTGAIINVPAPSQCSEMRETLSADYWHDVREELRARHGDIFVLPQCAAAGDLSPRIQHYYAAQQRRFALKYGAGKDTPVDLLQRRDIAERICAAFDEVLGWARREIHAALPIRHEVAVIGLSRRMITDEELANETRELEALEAEPFKSDGTPEEQLRHNSVLVARRNRCRRILARAGEQKTQPTCPVELHVARLGNIAFATNPFELYMDYMHRIQGRSPFEQTFVIQLTGGSTDTAGYLATERGVWGGGYSASIYCNQVSPKGGQELVEETLKRLARFAP